MDDNIYWLFCYPKTQTSRFFFFYHVRQLLKYPLIHALFIHVFHFQAGRAVTPYQYRSSYSKDQCKFISSLSFSRSCSIIETIRSLFSKQKGHAGQLEVQNKSSYILRKEQGLSDKLLFLAGPSFAVVNYEWHIQEKASQ